MNAGAFQETITVTGAYRFITRPIGRSQYYLRIILAADGSIGAARMYMADKEEDLLNVLSAGWRQ